jgi:hypothetical protein
VGAVSIEAVFAIIAGVASLVLYIMWINDWPEGWWPDDDGDDYR